MSKKEFTRMQIGELYLKANCFEGEANQTMFAPALGKNFHEIIANRKNVAPVLTEFGLQAIKKVEEHFADKFGVKIISKWDIHTGCSQCPCSPGFKIYIEIKKQYKNVEFVGRGLRGNERYKVYYNSQGEIKVIRPEYSGQVHSVIRAHILSV